MFSLSTQCTSMCFNASLLLLKSFFAIWTREVCPVLLTLLVFLNITQFHVLNQFCIINVHFLADSTFIVLCFLVDGLRLYFKQVAILPMFASSRSSYSAPSASSFTPRVSFRTLMEIVFLMRQILNKIRLSCCSQNNVGYNIEMDQTSAHYYIKYSGKNIFLGFHLKYKINLTSVTKPFGKTIDCFFLIES